MEKFIEFLGTPWGTAVFAVVALAVIIFFLAVNYRFFAKAFLDFLFSLIFLIVLSPCIGVCAALLKAKTGKVTEKHWIVGKGGKPVAVHTFAPYILPDGSRSYISRSCIKYFPLLADVLCGKLSLVGPSPLSLKDGSLIDDEYEPRFSVRPGIFTAACINFAQRPDYEQMFAADCDYAAKRGLFSDIRAVLTSFLRAVRGENSGFLAVGEDGYAETLLREKRITEDQYEQADKLAEEELEALRRAPMRVG